MNKIVISLEYGQYPVWIYNDNGELILNDLPMELSWDRDIDDVFLEIQNTYDNLFVKSPEGLKFIGFERESDKEQLLQMIDNAIILIKMRAGNLFEIEKKLK